jgi:hypothetical protein
MLRATGSSVVSGIACLGKLWLKSPRHINTGMTTDRQMVMMYAEQQQVIDVARSIGDLDLAERLEDCTATCFARHSGSGWPRICDR